MAFEEDARIAVEALARYESSSRTRAMPVLHQEPLADLVSSLDIPRWIRDGGLGGEALGAFVDRYLAASTRLHHPRCYAHQVALPISSGAIAALIDGFTNNAMNIYEMGPAAAAIEYAVVNWMLGKVGFVPAPLPPGIPDPAPASGAGALVHGGSLANLCALLAARGRADPDAWQEGPRRDLVVIAYEASHYSVARAVGILGLGRRALVAAPIDADERIAPGPLATRIAELRAAGRTPMAVVANACSTAVGLHDPLRAIAEVCRASETWLHVDAAHGASALLSERLRGRLDGVELADSVVWHAHKMSLVAGR